VHICEVCDDQAWYDDAPEIHASDCPVPELKRLRTRIAMMEDIAMTTDRSQRLVERCAGMGMRVTIQLLHPQDREWPQWWCRLEHGLAHADATAETSTDAILDGLERILPRLQEAWMRERDILADEIREAYAIIHKLPGGPESPGAKWCSGILGLQMGGLRFTFDEDTQE
jgi:hypothetical protein